MTCEMDKILNKRNLSLIRRQFNDSKETNVNVRIWKMLNAPFPLPPCSFKYHSCEWEAIDVDLYGCKLCSSLHHCGKGQCVKYTVACEDYEVCSISGLCLRTTKACAEQEFFDTVLYTQNSRHLQKLSKMENIDFSFIETYVHELLLSPKTFELWEAKFNKIHSQICKEIEAEFDPNASFLAQFEKSMTGAIQRHNFSFGWNEALRRNIARKCVDQIHHTLSLCSSNIKLGIRPNELRNTVFGLVYLMRQGIIFANVSVIPKIENLFYFLPTESSLQKAYNFKPKYITDVENRCKFGFRSGKVSKASLRDLTASK